MILLTKSGNQINIVPGYMMICLDVKNVYTSIPEFEVLDIIKAKLTLSNKFIIS